MTTAPAVCALWLSAAAFGQTSTFTVMPVGTPTDLGGISLSASGSQGVLGTNSFWDFPQTFTLVSAGGGGGGGPVVTRVSPDGQWAIGRSSTQNRAARFSRSNGFDAFPNSTSGLVPNTAYASNSGSNVVVGYGLVNGATTTAFMWQQGAGTADLGVATGDRSSVLLDVNSGGDVAVGWGEPSFGGVRHPLVWQAGSGWSRLNVPSGGTLDGGEARGVSSSGGVIVGTFTSGSAVRGFRWSSTGLISLPSPANPQSATLQTEAWDVSADGAWTVGQAQDTAPGGGMIATLWDAQGTPHRLSDLLGSEQTHALYQLRTATSVSDDGHTVSGIAFDPATGQLRSYVATWTAGGTGGECAADLGGAGGQAGQDGALDNNDFIVFISDFFNESPSADFGSAGGVAGADGFFDNNDFIAFIQAFFDGCEG
ncbi:MAG: GC-type dockerin domain-anchored protein [Phycisphaerales bacterium]